MKAKTENVMLPSGTKKEFVDECRSGGLKIYVAADQAVRAWLMARKWEREQQRNQGPHHD